MIRNVPPTLAKKGGQASGGRQSSDTNRPGSGQGAGRQGNLVEDREKMSDADKKGGGQTPGGGRKP